MGQGTSKPDKVILELPEDGRYFGFENFGNTCYCNSVLQALYFCAPFRQRVLEYAAAQQARPDAQESILTCLAELFAQVSRVAVDQLMHRGYAHTPHCPKAVAFFLIYMRIALSRTPLPGAHRPPLTPPSLPPQRHRSAPSARSLATSPPASL